VATRQAPAGFFAERFHAFAGMLPDPDKGRKRKVLQTVRDSH
jgi:hypothetical protein